jgi:hypothetical protein
VALAARGARNLDTGVEGITDAEMKAGLQSQARRVRIKSLAFGVLATAFTIFLAVI